MTNAALHDKKGRSGPFHHVQALVGSLWRTPRLRQLAAYLFVSIAAIAPDMVVFTALIWSGVVTSSIAGAISYVVAMGFHYILAATIVFDASRTNKSRRRILSEYLASGVVGVIITMLTIHLLTAYFAASPYLAKVAGIVASFIAVYLLRAFIIFRPKSSAGTGENVPSETNAFAVDSTDVYAEIAERDQLEWRFPDQEIAVLLPCYNEEAAIGATVAAFQTALPDATIYVYDNNSSDKTAELAAAAGAVVRHEPMQGKGNVVRRMFADVEADIYVLADGDMTYDAAAAGWMVSRLIHHNIDMVVGTRVADADAAFRAGHRFGNRLFNTIFRELFGDQFSDILSGYRVMSRRFAKSFPASSTGFEIETELSIYALDLRLPTMEVALRYRERPENSTSKLRTYTDGIRIMFTILRMFRRLKPKVYYGGIGVAFATLSALIGLPVVVEFFETGLVPRLPTALLAVAIGQLAMVCIACGLILEAITRSQREHRRIRYLNFSAPSATTMLRHAATQMREALSPKPSAAPPEPGAGNEAQPKTSETVR